MKFNSLLNDVLQYAQKAGAELGSKIAEGDTKSINKVSGIAGSVGMLGSLLGRKMGGSGALMKLGSAAALGALAYQAYQKYAADKTPPQHAFTSENTPDNAESSKVVLRAMVAAAAADGEISSQERKLIENESQNVDANLSDWLVHEFEQPASVDEIARDIGNNQALAAEAYLAARVVCGDLSRSEIVFLADLSRSLNLDDKLVKTLEEHAGF